MTITSTVACFTTPNSACCNFAALKNRFFIARQYFSHLLKAKGANGIHSPFLFELYTQVLSRERMFYDLEKIESLRQNLLQDQSVLRVDDLGAGSSGMKTADRRLCEIVRYASQSKRFTQLLFQLSHFFRPAISLELGTSLGIGAAALSLGNPAGRVLSIEGSQTIAERAEMNLKNLGINNCRIIRGSFDDVLPGLLKSISSIDLLYMDGNHRMNPTIHYFEIILPKLHPGSVIIMDDIHWSGEMHLAWKTISSHPRVSISIDFFRLGLLFLQKGVEKQHHILRIP